MNFYLQIEYINQIIKYGMVMGKYRIEYKIEIATIYHLDIIEEKSHIKVLYKPIIG